MAKAEDKSAVAARLAAKLKENLKRRKLQARARGKADAGVGPQVGDGKPKPSS